MKAKQLGLDLPIHADTPDTKADTGKQKNITIRWQKKSGLPTIRGKWKRLDDGRIEANYTQDEMKTCNWWDLFNLR